MAKTKNPVRKLTIARNKVLQLDLSEYPNFHFTGSVSIMRKKYYGHDAPLVQYRGYIYHVPQDVYDKV